MGICRRERRRQASWDVTSSDLGSQSSKRESTSSDCHMSNATLACKRCGEGTAADLPTACLYAMSAEVMRHTFLQPGRGAQDSSGCVIDKFWVRERSTADLPIVARCTMRQPSRAVGRRRRRWAEPVSPDRHRLSRLVRRCRPQTMTKPRAQRPRPFHNPVRTVGEKKSALTKYNKH